MFKPHGHLSTEQSEPSLEKMCNSEPATMEAMELNNDFISIELWNMSIVKNPSGALGVGERSKALRETHYHSSV